MWNIEIGQWQMHGKKTRNVPCCLAVGFLKFWSHPCIVFPPRGLTWRCFSDSPMLWKWLKYFEALFLQASHAVQQVQMFWDCRKSPHQLRGQKKNLLSPGILLQSAVQIMIHESISKFTLLDGGRFCGNTVSSESREFYIAQIKWFISVMGKSKHVVSYIFFCSYSQL